VILMQMSNIGRWC